MAKLKLSTPTLSLAATALLLGFVLAVVQPPRERGVAGDPARSPDVAQVTIMRLEGEQKALRAEVERLRGQIQLVQETTAKSKESLKEIGRELERHRFLAGMTPLSGPGLRVILDDSPRKAAPGEEAANYLIRDYQIRDVVHLLWQAGAEAASINNERLVSQSAIYGIGTTILVNGARLAPPYEVRAIGDIATMYPILASEGNLYQLRRVVQRFGLVLRVERVENLSLSAYRGPVTFRYATVGHQ